MTRKPLAKLENLRRFLQVANACELLQSLELARELNEGGVVEHIESIREQIDRMIIYVSSKIESEQ